jgi:peroxiredoxin
MIIVPLTKSPGQLTSSTKNGYIEAMCKPILYTLAATLLLAVAYLAAQNKPPLSSEELSIQTQVRGLRQVPDSQRGEATTRLAVRIRRLPKTQAKLALAESLANRSTEGDFGRNTLQEVAATLAAALAEQPLPDGKDGPARPYVTLAQLVRCEGVDVSPSDPPFRAAMEKLATEDRRRESADLTLLDLNGKPWTLSALRGSVVLVNFWATWCPPCRKEIPDLGALYKKYEKQGLVVLGISDETSDKVAPFVREQQVRYPILLDPGRTINERFGVEGIPNSYVYNREGKLVATAIDMRTRQQFLGMLAKAGMDVR